MRSACEVSITIKVTTIRDGTHGISMSVPDKLIGEWTDSKAVSLTLTDNLAVCICGEHGARRYLITMPGTPIRGQQISEVEATVIVSI